MTVATFVTLREGAEPEWDAAMRERLARAVGRPGFLHGQLLIPLDGLNRRAVVGTWSTRAEWEAWHNDPAFLATRERLDDLQREPSETHWYEVIEDQPHAGAAAAVTAAVNRVRDLAGSLANRAGDATGR
jgi:heme-degrading monooxygenase HmoA